MKLKECLELGKDCGLETLGECLSNVQIHAPTLFAYDQISDEWNELIKETNDYVNLRSYLFSLDTGIEIILNWIQLIDENYNKEK